MTRDKYIESLIRLKDTYKKEAHRVESENKDNSFYTAISISLVINANVIADEILFLQDESIKELKRCPIKPVLDLKALKSY